MNRQGFTLLEMGFVIGVVGVIILFTATLSSNWHGVQSRHYRADAVVQDVQNIVAATWAFATGFPISRQIQWPNQAGTISIDPLGNQWIFRTLPKTRYSEKCVQTGCGDWDYALTGWDRDKTGSDKSTACICTNSSNACVSATDSACVNLAADDVTIKFRVAEDKRIVDSIVARIPHGRIASIGTNNSYYELEARLIKENAPSSAVTYVQVPVQNNDVTFDKGDLQGILWVSRGTPAGADEDNVFPGFPYNKRTDDDGNLLAGGEALVMLEDGVYLGTFNDKGNNQGEWDKVKNISGYMALRSDSSGSSPEATMGAVVELNPPTQGNFKHELKIGVQNGVPVFEVVGNIGRTTAPDPERRFRMDYTAGDTSWDVHFAYGFSNAKSLQCRICRLERLADDYKTDISHDPTFSPFVKNLTGNDYEDDSCSSFTDSACGY